MTLAALTPVSAAAVTATPTGIVTATDVQGALEELADALTPPETVEPVTGSGYVATYAPGTPAPGDELEVLELELPAAGLWLLQADVEWTFPAGATDLTGTRLGIAATGDPAAGGIRHQFAVAPFDPSGADAPSGLYEGHYEGGGTISCGLNTAWNDPVADAVWWFASVTLRAIWIRS